VNASTPAVDIALIPRGRGRSVAAASLWLRSRRVGNSWPLPAIAIAVVALLLIQPAIPEGTQVLLATAFMYVALAQGWNLIGGFTGYASFGQVGFFGVGAYTTAVMMANYHLGFWVTLPVAIVVGTLLAIIAGIPLLRLKGHYFAIATLGMATGMGEIVNNLGGITHGGAGIEIPVFGSKAATPYPGDTGFYIYFLLIAAVTVAFLVVLTRSRFGYAMRAIHQDQDAAAAVGVNTTWVKVAAFALSGAITAAAGAFSGFQTIQFYPTDVFATGITVQMVIMVLIGGSGSIGGPIAGAIGLTLLNNYLSAVLPGYSYLVLGGIIVLVVVLFPQGVVTFFTDSWKQRRVSLLDNIRRYRL
jgi:branched-chain amino acid transport system permease protein